MSCLIAAIYKSFKCYSLCYCFVPQVWEVWGIGSVYNYYSCDVWSFVYSKRKVKVTNNSHWYLHCTCNWNNISTVQAKWLLSCEHTDALNVHFFLNDEGYLLFSTFFKPLFLDLERVSNIKIMFL